MRTFTKRKINTFNMLRFSLLSLGLSIGAQQVMAEESTCLGVCGSACDSFPGSYTETCFDCTVSGDKLSCTCITGDASCNNTKSGQCCSELEAAYQHKSHVKSSYCLNVGPGYVWIVNNDGTLVCGTKK